MISKQKLLIKFGASIKEERLRQGLSQEELAIKANVHRTYIGMIERGEKNITLSNLHKLAIGLGVPLSKLVSSLV